MLGVCSRVIALTAMVAGLSMTAQAAEPTTLTLACKGTATDLTQTDAKPETISMGIIVNFTARTVAGFTYDTARTGAGYVYYNPVPAEAEIKVANEAIIVFSGDSKNRGRIQGSIDRVTGAVEVWLEENTYSSTGYSLKCSPTQRKF